MMTKPIVSEGGYVATRLMLECIKVKDELKRRFDEFGWLGCYTLCEQLTYSFYPLYVPFRPEEFNMDFYRFSQDMEKNQNYIETIDLPEGIVLFVYKIPDRFLNDYELIKQGRVTHTSVEFKTCFPMFKYRTNEFGGIWKGLDGRPQRVPTIYNHIFSGVDGHKVKYNEEEETLKW